jgi:hypothetical protein
MTCQNCHEEIMRSEVIDCLICGEEICSHCKDEHYIDCGHEHEKADRQLSEIDWKLHEDTSMRSITDTERGRG